MQQILSVHLGGADLIRIDAALVHPAKSSVRIQDPDSGLPFEIHGSLVALARLRDALTAHLDGTDRVDIVHQPARPPVAEAVTDLEPWCRAI